MKPTFYLPSPETGTTYHIYVLTPDRKREPGPWSVVLFLDGDDQFAAGVKGYRQARRARRVPPLLLVGVGYGASYSDPQNHRGRDYTPVHHRFEPSSGGADVFLKFLTHTLWPELQRRYPAHPRQRAIAGHSLGSLFVLYALFQPKPFFSGYLASAPSIWWADCALLRHVKRLRARRATLRARLYLAVGGRDSDSMRGDLVLLEQLLAARPFRHLRVTAETYPDRNHYNALADTFPSGLAQLF